MVSKAFELMEKCKKLKTVLHLKNILISVGSHSDTVWIAAFSDEIDTVEEAEFIAKHFIDPIELVSLLEMKRHSECVPCKYGTYITFRSKSGKVNVGVHCKPLIKGEQDEL